MSIPPELYEKLGAFYLGRLWDAESRETLDEPLLYDSRDLTTHAVCVGMTGSGKTGLGVGLLEEAAIDGVPALILDPKGDLTNLALTFPGLSAREFRPWVDPDAARRQGMDLDAYAAEQARLWKQGLASWGQGPERIQRLRDAVDVAIYTPGSEAGRELSILSSFDAPAPSVVADGDLFRDQVASAAESLLALLGQEVDPVRSREHILLSTLLEDAWRQGHDLDIAGLIRRVQSPPMSRVGVLEMESFYPASDRFELALALNNLLAAPGFASWMAGDPLDIGRLLYTPRGRPRQSVIYLAHLSERERMFVVTLLLSRLVGWMRTQSGTGSLRALLYMDEVFGYMPPVAAPPSKRPLLTLLKQARAYGIGVVLATQNPVDLDYKGLSNAGTWFLGRLQTERDRERVLDGLEGITAGSRGWDRKRFESLLGGLDKRVFLMHDVHEAEPALFQTRWVMSYLRGPLTRAQLRGLDAAGPATGSPPEAPAARTATASIQGDRGQVPLSPTPPGTTAVAAPTASAAPLLPPDVPQAWLAPRAPGPETIYRAQLLGLADVHFVDRRRDLKAEEHLSLLAGLDGGPDWDDAVPLELAAGRLADRPPAPGRYLEVPAEATEGRAYRSWEKELSDWIYRERRYALLHCESLDAVARPGESERDFRVRLAAAARERRDQEVEELTREYDKKFATLRERIRKAEQDVQQEEDQARGAKMQAAISLGATLLSAMLGRRTTSTTIGKATTTARGAGRAMDQARDVAEAEADLEARRRELAELEERFREDVDGIEERFDVGDDELSTLELAPRRKDVDVDRVILLWTPFEPSSTGILLPAW